MIRKQIKQYFHPRGANKIYPQNGFEMWQINNYQIGIDYELHEFIVFSVRAGNLKAVELNGEFSDGVDLIEKLKIYVE
jgi:hypothetical protein